MPDSNITYTLSRNEAGQVIDGLSICLENWQKTLSWYDGTLDDLEFIILDCSDRDEAANMVLVYENLLSRLREQKKAQA